MLMVNVHEAKARLSDMLARVEAGETVVIARRNKPVAQLVRTTQAPPKEPRRLGAAKGRIVIHPAFFEPLDDESASLFSGETLSPEDPLNPDWKPRP